jgi:hypothetical protein
VKRGNKIQKKKILKKRKKKKEREREREKKAIA